MFIIRNDDVAFDTKIEEIKKFCEICDKYGYTIIQSITPMGVGGHYARAEMTNELIKLRSPRRFEDNKQVLEFLKSRNDLIGVHGLWHTHNSTEEEIKKGKELLQELDFNPTYFVPPFNEGEYPETVVGLTTCQLDFKKGDLLETFLKEGEPTSPIMYLHSWRFNNKWFTFDQLDQCLGRLSKGIEKQNAAYFSEPKNVRRYALEEGLRDIERDLVSKFMPKLPAKLIDLGCGGGRTSGALAEAGYTVTAIDLSQPLIEHARQRYPGLDFRVMNATAMTFPDENFDAALFSFNGIDGLFPLTERLRCLNEIWRVLKPGGVFILSTHNLIGHIFGRGDPENIKRLVATQHQNPHLFDWYARYDAHGGPQFLFSAPPSTTRDQLVSAGFEILDIRGVTNSEENYMFWNEPHIYFVVRKRVINTKI